MRTYRCKYCREKNPIDWEQIIQWVHRFDSKGCRLKFINEQKRKDKEKVKVKKVKVREKKANSISVLKIKLWKIVSEYIRRRDSDKEWIWKCCTCDTRKHWKELQAWHYIPSWSSSFHRYNDTNIHIQCFQCNVRKHWNLIEYRPFMIENYWLTHVEELYETRNNISKLWSMEIQDLIKEYTIKLNNLK